MQWVRVRIPAPALHGRRASPLPSQPDVCTPTTSCVAEDIVSLNSPAAAMAVHPAMRPRNVALAGLVSLAVAMGIGRFAFTPLLPMMLHDGVLDLAAGSWLASANYLGYLVGAVLCTLQPWIWRGCRRCPPCAIPAGSASAWGPPAC